MRFSLTTDFDITSAIKSLEQVGGVSIPILSEDHRQALLAEALLYHYVKKPEVVGTANVRQDFYGVGTLREDSLFWALRDGWTQLLTSKLSEVGRLDSLFDTPLCFNELALQRYEPGSFGITPHRDSSCNINLICVFNLTGHSRFGLCSDRAGQENITLLDDHPGNVILLRSPGFKAPRQQPFHFLSDIPELRISFGIRQVIET